MDSRIQNRLSRRKEIQKRRRNARLKVLVLVLFIAFVIVLLVDTYVLSLVRVQGNSMQRTLYDGDRILVQKLMFNQDDIKIDDLVYFKAADDVFYVKRIVARPSDAVEIVNNKVYVNGVERIEDYTNGQVTEVYGESKWILDQDEYFVLGDNRYKDLSRDSRLFGPISFDQIEGKVIYTMTKER